MVWLTGWDYRKKITIQDAYVDSNLSNFPVYIYLDPAVGGASLGSKIKDDGFDVRFTDSDEETLLKYDRLYYNEAGGNSQAYFFVKVPTVYASPTGVQNEIYMYYGKSDAPDGKDTYNTWDDNFEAVWHLIEIGDGSIGEFINSAKNLHHGRGGGGTAGKVPAQIDGKIYKGQDFELTGGPDYIDVGSDAGLDFHQPMTISLWINMETTAEPCMYAAKDRAATYNGLRFRVGGSYDKLQLLGNSQIFEAGTQLSSATWYHIGVTYNTGGAYVAYLNGESDGSGTNDVSADYGTHIIGAWNSGSESDAFDGIIDELRISSSIRNGDWIRFEFRNVNESDNELTWSGEEGAPAGDININVIEVE